MSPTRRTFLRTATFTAAGTALAGESVLAGELELASQSGLARESSVRHPALLSPQDLGDRFDPWIEVDAEGLAHNVAEVRRLSANRPILAVVKNNAYGLDVTRRRRSWSRCPRWLDLRWSRPRRRSG